MLFVNLSGVRQRPASVLTIIVGVTCAVGVSSPCSPWAPVRAGRRWATFAPQHVLITSGARVWQSDIS